MPEALQFEFATANKIIFGAGKLRETGALATAFGRRALVVTGRDSSRAEKLLALLRQAGVSATVFPVSGEPELSTVERGFAMAKNENCELFIGFGGGSALDTAKAIAAMRTNDGELLDFVEVIGRGKTMTKPSAPFIAIPTTAGTGTEVTRNSVLSSPEHKLKVSLRSPLMLPRIALVDPELTYNLPATITARTGLDTLTQLIEPFVCSRANPITDGLCVEGLRRVARSLRAAFYDGQNKPAREDMAMASLFGGLALANAGLGAVHGFAGPIGGMFSAAPHGAICAALLPSVMGANIRALRQRAPNSRSLERYHDAARLLTGDPSATAEDGVKWVRQLVDDLKMPHLGSYGVEMKNVPELIQRAAQANSMKANPVLLTPEELSETLHAAL
jgi:alcohol dehydrogenase class IV